MERRLGYIVAIAASLLVTPSAFAQTGTDIIAIPIVVETDMITYGHDDTVEVTGMVRDLRDNVPVTLRVIGPQGNIVAVKQIDVDPDTNSFGTSLSTSGMLWNYDGRYTIKVQYGGASSSNKAYIDLTGGTISNPIRQQETAVEQTPVSCGDGEFAAGQDCVGYSITGGSVTGASATSVGGAGNSLVIGIDALRDGSITLTPNKSACGDRDYIVLVDGQQWDDFTLTGDSLTVNFFAGNGEVEIVGACVVPEFGGLAALILVASLAAIIVASSRGRTGIMPKY